MAAAWQGFDPTQSLYLSNIKPQIDAASYTGGGEGTGGIAVGNPYSNLSQADAVKQWLGTQPGGYQDALSYYKGNGYQTNANGQVMLQGSDTSFDPGYGVMAALTAGFGAIAAPAIAAGMGAGGSALAGGSGLVDGLGTAAAGYGGAVGGSGLVDGLGAAAAGYGGGAGLGAAGAAGGGMDLSSLASQFAGYDGMGGGSIFDSGLGASAGGGSSFLGDIPTTGDVGGTSIYGSNPSLSDLFNQYQMSGQSPAQFLQQLSGMPNTPPGTSTALQTLLKGLGGNGNSSGLGSLGSLLAAGLGAYGSNRQAQQLGTLSQQYAGYGAPYRAMLASSYADPNSFLANSPDIKAAVGQGTDALAHSLSTQGNPAGSGAALQQLQNYATQGLYGQLGNARNQLANFGGLSNFNQAAPGLAGQQIQAQGNTLNAIGSGISSFTNPPTTIEQFLNSINGMSGLKLGNGITPP